MSAKTFNLWFRLGVSAKVTLGELSCLLWGNTKDMLKTLFQDGRVKIDGDTYIPESIFSALPEEADLAPLPTEDWSLELGSLQDRPLSIQTSSPIQDELNFIKEFIRDISGVDEKEDKRQLRALWTALCFHADWAPDTMQYDEALKELWLVLEETHSTAWTRFDAFDNYMVKYLV